MACWFLDVRAKFVTLTKRFVGNIHNTPNQTNKNVVYVCDCPVRVVWSSFMVP